MTAIATAPTSPKDILVAYRADARAKATVDGRPGDRSDFPGLGLPATGMIYSRGKGLQYQALKAPAVPLTPDLLEKALIDPMASTVVSDAKTWAKVLVMADNLPSNDFKALGRRLRISRGLPVSLKLPVLTEFLGYRYWLPDTLNETSLDDWADAFGVKGPSITFTMRSLIALAEAGAKPAALKYELAVKSMEEMERKIMEQAAWGGISNDCYVYSMLEGYSAKANGLRTIDPGLLEMHVIDGQACRIVPMNSDSREFSASVSSPFKLKEGKKVRLTDGKEMVEVDLRALRFGDGALHAVFSQPSARGAGLLMVSKARKLEARLYAVDGVFESFGAGPKNKRWLGDDVQKVTGRDVPLDVMLAGAPTTD
ncbi:hypothetical protein [Paenarthrobacter sp. C1]|uniref:hypothetical protein n=1 Tax=Paenarthrobacter sp. C1 TaxID=3400220 RepID=UPI003BF4D3C0